MLNNKLKQLVRVRVFSSIIDLIVFFLLFGVSFGILLDLFDSNVLLLGYPFIFYILYFSVLTSVMNGYTLGGYLLGIKIIKLNSERMSFLDYLFRFLYALLAYFYFFGYVRIKVNSYGQFFFDKPFQTTVIQRKDKSVKFKSKLEEYTYYFFTE